MKTRSIIDTLKHFDAYETSRIGYNITNIRKQDHINKVVLCEYSSNRFYLRIIHILYLFYVNKNIDKNFKKINLLKLC
jgi:hypothetical protein